MCADPIEKCVVKMAEVDGILESIILRHKVRLVTQNSMKHSSPSGSKLFTEYISHHGGRVGRKGGDHRRLRTSNKCGCPFKVVVHYPPLGMENVIINVYGHHEGHMPGSRSDLFHLPVHPSVIMRCMEDLFDVGTCQKDEFGKGGISLSKVIPH